MNRLLARGLAALALALPLGAQTTWYVDLNGTPPGDGSQANPYTSLQACFGQNSTVDGDTVLVLPGTYVEDLDLLGKSLDVQSTAGAATTILQAATATSVLRVVNVADGRLEGLTLRGGSGTSDGTHRRGGAVYCSGSSLELVLCVLADSHADIGGGLAALNGSAVTVDQCEVRDNDAQQGGGIHANASALTVYASLIQANRGSVPTPGPSLMRSGGGVCTSGGATLEMFASEVNGCSPASPNGDFTGGGLFLGGASARLEDCTIANCGGTGIAFSAGGGISTGLATELVRCTIRNNSCLYEGGGVLGGASFDDCDILDNFAIQGGGSRSDGFFSTFTNCRILDNDAWALEGGCSGPGGGVYGGTLIGCRIEGNSSSSSGGGAYEANLIDCEVIANRLTAGVMCSNGHSGAGLSGGSATDCLFEENEITAAGQPGYATGGAAAGATLTRCTLRANRVDGGHPTNNNDPFRGGGAAGCTLIECIVEDNEVLGWSGTSAQGGGVHSGSATDCIIRGNRAESLAPGHTLAMGGGAAEAALSRCQVFDNEADHGGGAWKCNLARCSVVGNTAFVQGGALSVHPGGAGNGTWGAQSVVDSISWGNVPDELYRGMGSIVATYSAVLGDYPGVGNIDDDPSFWSELTGDLHLRGDSPCIDAGDPNAPLDPDGTRRDMGALPFDASYVGGPYVYCAAKETSQGCLPSIGSSGTPTLSGPDDFVVSASQVVQNQNGILFWGLAADAAPFMGGLRCVANPVVRTPVSNSGGVGACGGVLSFAFTQSYFATEGLVAGDRLFAQFWFRDPAQPDGTGVGLSDALDFTLLP